MKSLKSLWIVVNSRNDGLRARLVRGAVGSFALKVANTLLNLVTGILLARLLGTEGYGVYAFAIALITILTVPSQFGLPTMVIRQVAAYRIQQKWSLLCGLLRRTNQVVLILSLMTMMVSGAVVWLQASHLNKLSSTTFGWALCLIPLLALGALRSAALVGLHQVILGQIPELLIRPVFLLVLMGGTYLGLGPVAATSYWTMAMNVIATAIAFALGTWWLWVRLPEFVKQSGPAYQTREWLRSAFPLFLVGGMMIINNQANIVVLGLLRTAEEVGNFRVAVTGASLVAFTLTAVNSILAPTVSQLYTQNDPVRLQRIVTLSARVTLLSSLPVALILVLFGKQLIAIMFGPEFAPTYPALAILCVGQLVNASMGSVGVLLNMTGHEGDTARGRAIATVLNVCLNALLIPFWGIEGAAIANSVSMVTWNVLSALWVRQKLQINSTAFYIP